MEKVLTQQEIDSMVQAACGSTGPNTEVTPWDYRQAGRIGREQLESISALHESFARNLTNYIAAFLRIDFKAGLVSAEHSTYREFLVGIPERSYLGSVRLAPLGASALMQIDFAMAFPLIDVLLGGEGVGAPAARQFTEIEEQILETVMRIICRELQNAWQSLELEFVFEKREDPDRVQNLLAADERILSLSFELTMKDSRGLMSIALPAVISTALMRKISAAQPRSKAMLCTPDARGHLQKRLLNCQFRMDLELGLSVPSAAEITSLMPGHILGLKQRADGMAALVVAGQPVFAARIARIGEARAAQVTASLGNHVSREGTSC